MDKISILNLRRLDIYSHVGPFDKGVAALKAEGLNLWTGEDLAVSRTIAGAQHPLSGEGAWVSQGFVYPVGRDADNLLVVAPPYNPLLQHPEAATAEHSANREFYVSEAFTALRERAAEDPHKALQSGVLLLPRKKVQGEIPPHTFGEHPLTLFLFEGQASAYGVFLQCAGITDVPLYVADPAYAKKQEQPFARALRPRRQVGPRLLGPPLHRWPGSRGTSN